MLLLALLFTLGVFNTEAEREEVVGVLGSSVLLDPEITVDSSKNDILWTFKASNKSYDVILDHVPGIATLEQSEQFKDRLQFNASNGALTISRLNASDQGDYIFTVDEKELKIMELLVIDKDKEEVAVLGSSVLLDPELKVDPSKSEIVWTFIGRSILHHVPGHSLVEQSDQFKFRLRFDISNGALTVNEAEHGDQGDYTFIVDGQELRIIQLRLVDELSEASIFTNIESLGFTVELTCDVSGDPNVYQWQKNGGEISQHHQLTDENRTLVIPSASSEDCGVYTCITTNPVSSIQTNYTLMLQGLSLKDVILIAVLTAGQAITGQSLHSAVLPDQWRWKTLGGCLGYRFYFLSLWICNTLSLIAMYIVFVYWSVVGGLSPLDFVVICVLIVGLQLSSFYINELQYVTEIWELLEDSKMITIWWKLKAVCDIVLINCFIIAWIVSSTTFGLSTVGIVTIVLSIILPLVFILILMCRYIKEYSDEEYSFKDALIKALQFVGLMLPLVNVMLLFYLIYKKIFDEDWVFFQTGFFNMVFLLGISVSNSIPGFYSEDTVTFAASITMVVLLVVAFISFAILWWKGLWYEDDDKFQRWMSVYNVGFLIVVIIATISWMVFKGLRPEDVGVVVTSMVGLVFSTAYAIIFMCWSRKGYPDDKQWWWRLNICNIVALVFILTALICWIVTKDQSCTTNIPVWILFTLLGDTFVIALSRFFPVCSRNEGNNENNHADKKQGRGEVQELQTLSPGHEAEPEKHPVS
ncbi:uncharacterized protein LOC132394527 isoform X2 [Hypanus sabinus]|uniref:uncharacterized protein LOC132394527 isoform X2 n=1 Tax=Hypanus sabinus TaxID=79690 RepID=UPI0028C4EDA9|nr:uncharacterized protein LOC132394527 isoform X2 [Hypanus sabinus]